MKKKKLIITSAAAVIAVFGLLAAGGVMHFRGYEPIGEENVNPMQIENNNMAPDYIPN